MARRKLQMDAARYGTLDGRSRERGKRVDEGRREDEAAAASYLYKTVTSELTAAAASSNHASDMTSSHAYAAWRLGSHSPPTPGNGMARACHNGQFARVARRSLAIGQETKREPTLILRIFPRNRLAFRSDRPCRSRLLRKSRPRRVQLRLRRLLRAGFSCAVTASTSIDAVPVSSE